MPWIRLGSLKWSLIEHLSGMFAEWTVETVFQKESTIQTTDHLQIQFSSRGVFESKCRWQRDVLVL